MKRFLVCMLLLTAISAAFLPASSGAPLPAPAGSFLRSRAATADELVAQVRGDDAVAGLYARHFGAEVSDVVVRLRALRPMLLEHPVTVRYYFVDTKGNILSKVVTLPRSTAVFASGDGVPVLSWPYGNPIGASIEPPLRAKDAARVDADSVSRTSDSLPGIISAPAAGANGLATSPDGQLNAPITADPVAMVTMPNPALSRPGGPDSIQSSGLNGRLLAGIGGAAGALGALAMLSSANGGSGLIENAGPNPVPEPQGLIALGLGMTGFGLLRWRRRR